MWKIWCELPQMSNDPGELRSGQRIYPRFVLVVVSSRF